MEDNGLKYREHYATTIDINILKEFREIHEITKIPLSRLADEAFQDLVMKYKKSNYFDKFSNN